MANEYNLPLTGEQIAERLNKIPDLAEKTELPANVSQLQNDAGYATEQFVKDGYQPKGNYLTEHQSLEGYAKTTDIPTKVSQLTNDSKYITASGAPVQSVNGKSGSVVLSASDVGARPSTWTPSASDVGALPNTTKIPAKTSDLNNDSGFITGYTETDPTVPAWAKEAKKPTYSASEVGLGNVDNVKQYSANNPPPYPVTSVNSKTGAVTLDASAVGARPATWMPSYSDVGAEKAGTAATAVSTHNTNTDAHNDIRLLVIGLATRLDALANSDDETLDQMAEVVAYIKDNRDLIDQITTGKISYTDIVNNLTTNVNDKPLSAAQGVALKKLIDGITVPTKLSDLTDDKGYITGYTETDPTVPSWAKATTKPSYTKSEVGLGNVDNVKQYSASNPPPYPVTSVNGKTGAVTVDVPTVPTKVSAFNNDAGYITGYTETDPTVPAWAKNSTKPTYTASEVGAVPTSRTINGKKLTGNITLSASDVGAREATWIPTPGEIGAVSEDNRLTLVGVDANGTQHTFTVYGGNANEPT